MVLTHRCPGWVLVPRHAGGSSREGDIGDSQARGHRGGWIGLDTDAVYSAASDGRPREQGGGAHVSSLHAAFRQRECERVTMLYLEGWLSRRHRVT